MITIKSLRKSFGSNIAVDDISLTIDSGESLGLLGPNGAGKTTTIHILTGALEPDAGSVRVADHAPQDVAARSQLGLVPQSLALYENLSATENLTFFAKLYDLGHAELRTRVAWALEFAGLEARGKHRVSTFSGGMKRRLNMACALVHDPPIIIMDEPTVGVDPQSRNHIFDSIEQLKSEGRTILYTTHYMEEAERLCDRIAIMDHGKVLDIGALNELLDRHGGPSNVSAQVNEPVECEAELPYDIRDGQLAFAADDPLSEVNRLAAAGLDLQGLEIRRPNLESVFLTLTGRNLRDE